MSEPNPFREPVHPGDRDFGDPTRRTYFAEERTLLSWWRSGLTALGVALGVGRVVPSLAKAPRGPFVALGAGYAVLGLIFVVYGSVRQRMQEDALAAGSYRSLDRGVVVALTALLAALAVATIVLVFAA
jgi:uncharacterized membrane protein YidH (DUF202 family)